MQLPAQLQEFLFERVHFDPQLAGHLEEGEIIGAAGDLLELAAAGAEMRALGALVAVPADQRGIRCGRCWCHFCICDKFSPSQFRAQKKWLAGAAANHWSDSPCIPPLEQKRNLCRTDKRLKKIKSDRLKSVLLR